MTDSTDDITRWIAGLNAGDAQAAEGLWKAYFDNLTLFARRRFQQGHGRTADEEDVALSAMHSFYRGVKAGRYQQLKGRDELWRLLVTIVLHKISRQRRKQTALKRGGGHVRGESAFAPIDGSDAPRGLEQMLASGPTPDLAAMLVENSERLLASLEEEPLQQVARDKLEGYTNQEIATRLGCTVRSIERKLNRIRTCWMELGVVDGAT
jgi:DNA-directed RNA polymerase specialized sigma24 family protein